MIYLDYSATTPVNKEVLDSFNKTCLEFPGNSNSLHTLGVRCNSLIASATKQIAGILNIKEDEIIYTSGSSESNNLAIKGICDKYANRGKHIISTNYEHSSIYGPLDYLKGKGFEIDYVKTDKDGIVDLEDLKKILRDDTILVTINAVNSEIGIMQPINEIGKIIKENSNAFFHTDLTQMVGKVDVKLDYIDLASFSAHKFYGLKGIGVLYKRDKVNLESLIHGGKSTTIYRSGTPAHPLIVSIAKALRLATNDLKSKYDYVFEINKKVVDGLSKYDDVYINSNDKCIPHILNISITCIKPETFLHALESHEVYISTQTACSSSSSLSSAVLDLIKDDKKARTSLRISLSHLTTKEEIDKFLNIFDECYKSLKLK